MKRRKNVIQISWVERPELKQIFAKTKILLAPATYQEPFGRTPIEAMCSGIPCIVSRRGGLPEVVGDAGIIIDDPFDIDAWVDAIRRLYGE